ncbi:MAG: RNA methyltransferase [bacterium]|nr:RNA methyltransferase [bacterium]
MITSNSNPKVKKLLTWQKKRKVREEDGIYIVEGLRMFVEAPQDKVREVYVSESFYKKKREELCLDAWGKKLEILSDSVYGHVSDTKTPQGVLVVMEQMKYSLEEVIAGKEGRASLLMVLDNLQDPGNLGTILRAGEAAGVTGVVMSSDCVDIYNPKVIRSTMGSIYRMPFIYVEDLPTVVKMLGEKEIHTYAAHLKGKRSYEEEDFTKGTAFLIGNEGNGLRDEVADAAEIYVKIPMCGEVESLNAAIAASVLMFEAARQRRQI